MTDRGTSAEVWADTCGHGCDLTALWRARTWPNRELSHATYRSIDDPTRTHRVGARWGAPRDVRDVRLTWDTNAQPAAHAVRLEGEPGAYTGVVVEQPAGAGSARYPGQLRIEALAVDFGGPVPLAVWVAGQRYVPAMPPPVDLSDVHAIELLAPADARCAVLTAAQSGGNGAHLVAWWREVAGDGWCDTSELGLSGGRIRLVTPVDGPIRLETPHPCPLLLLAIDFHVASQSPAHTENFGHPAPVLREKCRPRHAEGLFGGVGRAPDGRFELRPPGARSHALCLHVTISDDAVGLALADGVWPRPLDLDWREGVLRWADGSRILEAPGRTLRRGPREWRLEGEGPVRVAEQNRPALVPTSARLPDGWADLARGLVSGSRVFFEADGRVSYGAWPSVYHGDVFGLEEDYLFRGLAFWGLAGVGADALRATYLNAEHLDKRHYLRDLRCGLTPWQTEWILRLSGQALTGPEQALLDASADWADAERARVVPGDRFPELLPTFRFGGDLDQPAQAVYCDALNCVGLAALGRDTTDYRRAIDAAFADLDHGDRPGLHAGPDDPGDYYQLMAAGILLPVGYFAPDDPRAARIAAALKREDRLVDGLPRFDGWGPVPCIDAHYALGYLLHLLEVGRRADFWTGLCALRDRAMDPETLTFREVSPALAPPPWAEARVPARRLAQAEPCVGGPGVVLQLLRCALAHEMRGADGRPDGRVRLLAGIPPGWLEAELQFGPAPSWGGPVQLELRGGVLDVESPGGEVALPGRTLALAPGRQRVRLV